MFARPQPSVESKGANGDALYSSSRGPRRRTDRKTDVHAFPDADVYGKARRHRPVRPDREKAAGVAAIGEGHVVARGADSRLHDAGRHPHASRDERTGRRDHVKILDAYAVQRDAHYISNMWANIANPNRRHHVHVHPICLLSGLVYVRTPKNCGSTIFASPRQLTKNLEPTYLQKNELNSDLFTIPAEQGRMLTWPGP